MEETQVKKDVLGAGTLAVQGLQATLQTMSQWFDAETRQTMHTTFDHLGQLDIQLEYIAEVVKDQDTIAGGIELESSMTAMLGQAEFISGVASAAQAVVFRVLALLEEFDLLTHEILLRTAQVNGWTLLPETELKARLDRRNKVTTDDVPQVNAELEDSPASE